MKNWFAAAQPGAALSFVTELGSPGNYAMTHRDARGQVPEVSDRWQQALLFKRIAETLWSEI